MRLPWTSKNGGGGGTPRRLQRQLPIVKRQLGSSSPALANRQIAAVADGTTVAKAAAPAGLVAAVERATLKMTRRRNAGSKRLQRRS